MSAGEEQNTNANSDDICIPAAALARLVTGNSQCPLLSLSLKNVNYYPELKIDFGKN